MLGIKFNWLALLCLLGLWADTATAARNETDALSVFNITVCEKCVTDKNSIFCSEAESSADFVSVRVFPTFRPGFTPVPKNVKLTIEDKKKNFGVSDGAKFCWSGTFGKMLDQSMYEGAIFGSQFVNASVSCSSKNLFYNQCALPVELSIILLTIGTIVGTCGVSCGLFLGGCCRCCNNRGDDSRWGMCNRFCPWMPCADPPRTEKVIESSIINPITDEDHLSSLFGRNVAATRGPAASVNKDPNAPPGMGKEVMSMNPLIGGRK